jgi:hypothetical protein
MGYNEDEQIEKEKEEEKDYELIDQKDLDSFYSESTGTNPDGFGEETENFEEAES